MVSKHSLSSVKSVACLCWVRKALAKSFQDRICVRSSLRYHCATILIRLSWKQYIRSLSLSVCADIFLIYIMRCVVGHLVPSYLSNTRVLNLCGITKPCIKLSSATSTSPGILIPSTALNLSSRNSYFSYASFWCNFSFSTESSRSGTIKGFTRLASVFGSRNTSPGVWIAWEGP